MGISKTLSPQVTKVDGEIKIVLEVCPLIILFIGCNKLEENLVHI